MMKFSVIVRDEERFGFVGEALSDCKGAEMDLFVLTFGDYWASLGA